MLLQGTILLLLSWSCQQKETALKPLPSIEGTYKATVYRTDPNTFTQFDAPFDIITGLQTYPIDGHTITMEIKYVRTDTVQVDIKPVTPATAYLPAGLYSPRQALSFPKAYIKEVISGNQAQYFIYLNPTKTPSDLDDGIAIYGDNLIADYMVNVSVSPKVRVIIKFEKLY